MGLEIRINLFGIWGYFPPTKHLKSEVIEDFQEYAVSCFASHVFLEVFLRDETSSLLDSARTHTQCRCLLCVGRRHPTTSAVPAAPQGLHYHGVRARSKMGIQPGYLGVGES